MQIIGTKAISMGTTGQDCKMGRRSLERPAGSVDTRASPVSGASLCLDRRRRRQGLPVGSVAPLIRLLKYAAATLLAALHIINVDETDWAHRSQFGGRVFRQRGALPIQPASRQACVLRKRRRRRLLSQWVYGDIVKGLINFLK